MPDLRIVSLLVLPQLALTAIMLVGSQLIFFQGSFYEDIGLGRSADEFSFVNYLHIWNDPFYYDALLLTLRLSSSVVILTLIMVWPVAYMLSRMDPRWSIAILGAIVASSFLALSIKVLGLVILFSSEGPLVSFLNGIGMLPSNFQIIGSEAGVMIGYMHLAISFMVMMLFNVLQTVPRSYEEAAATLGANRWRVFWLVVIPLSLPGTIGASLILFNFLAGAFVSAAILGGGRIITLPVLIQRTLILFNDTGMASALSTILLLLVLLINIFSVYVITRAFKSREVVL